MIRMYSGSFRGLAGLLCGLVTTCCFAQPGKEKDPLSWDRSIHGMLQKYCFKCHQQDDPHGDVNLARDEHPRLLLEHRDVWETALAKIESGEMPPSDARKLPDDQRDLLIEFLTTTLNHLDCETGVDPGKPVLRRLNRTEYDLTIRDLTGVDLQLAESFVPDPTGYGFDNIGDILTLSSVQVEQFHDAARKVVAELIASREKQPDVYRRVFIASPDTKTDESQTARQIIELFVTRAFRRPVDAPFVDRLMKIYALARDQGADYETSVGHMLTTVLISPRFLMRVEKDRPDEEGPYLVDDYEMASRLSYFLWSRPPDEALLACAAKGELNQEEGLKAQTLRMLQDPRSQALADNFFGQWLGLRELDSHQPNAERFPEFNDELRKVIKDEALHLISAVIREDQPLTDLLDAKYTYLNESLAKFYGISDVSGPEFRKVALNDTKRGGLLTTAALLMLQSDPTRTNVPRRGNFIAGQILGIAPPAPPPDVPPLEASAADGKKRSLRELLELHRSKAECAGCHAKIDPLGFSLENYDAIGRWREKDQEFAIDPSGELPDGYKLQGASSLKAYLVENKALFRRTMAKHLLIYALGRGLQGQDECVVRDVLQSTEEQGDRFSAMILAIVQSDPFRYRKNAED